MLELNAVFKKTLEKASSSVTALSYELWLTPLVPLCVKDTVLYVSAPTKNVKDTVTKEYIGLLKKSLVSVNNSFTDIIIVTKEEEEDILSVADDSLGGEFVVKDSKKERKNPFVSRYTFDNFVVGDSNKFAFYAAKKVAETPGANDNVISYNPLFLYGGVGLGKTHLLHSIGNYIFKNYPSLKIAYIQTDAMVNEFFNAMTSNKNDPSKQPMQVFRDKYKKIDVLMLDDVQFLIKHSGVQDQFFQIFNDLYQQGKQIILSSDRPPKDMEIHARLASRFSGGVTVEIGQPNLDMRISIIRKKMQQEGIAVNNDVVFYLAENIDSNVRELEGALSKVILYSQLIGQECPDLNIAKEALKFQENRKEEVNCDVIIEAVGSYFRVEKSDILGKKKTKEIANARAFSMFLCTDMLSIPLDAIGQVFGKDHTTVMYARDKIAEKLRNGDDTTTRQVKDIKNIING